MKDVLIRVELTKEIVEMIKEESQRHPPKPLYLVIYDDGQVTVYD